MFSQHEYSSSFPLGTQPSVAYEAFFSSESNLAKISGVNVVCCMRTVSCVILRNLRKSNIEE